MRAHRALLAAALVLAALAAGCGLRIPLEYWFVDSLEKVFPDSLPGQSQLGLPTLYAARGAHATIQLALRANRTLGNVTVEATPLTGPGLPLETARVRWVEYVVAASNTPDTPDDGLVRKAPALFPDALLEEFPLTLAKDQTRSIWITVAVPRSQTPGEYRGELIVRQDREELVRLPYHVAIQPATVPERIPLAVSNHFDLSDRRSQQFFGCSRFSDEWWLLVGNVARFLAGYRQNTAFADPLDLVVARPGGGRLEYDFGNWERFAETFERAGVDRFLEGGDLLRRGRAPGSPALVRAWVPDAGRAVERDLPLTDAAAQRFLADFLPALHRRLQARGWTDRYLQGILDEPGESDRETFLRAVELVRKHMPGVRIVARFAAAQDLRYLDRAADIWIPRLGSFDNKIGEMETHMRAGGSVWLYTASAPRARYPNRFIDYPQLDVRLLHWINFKQSYRGFVHRGGNGWGPEPFKDTQPASSDGRSLLPPGEAYIAYPNRLGRSLYSSIRLEQMREGIEDYGLLEELKRRDEPRATKIALEAVGSFTEYVRDPARFRAIHRELLDALAE